MLRFILLTTALLLSQNVTARGTGDLGIVIERADGSVQIIETSTNTSLGRIEGLGDLSHASAVYSRDEQFAYILGRAGGLKKLDISKKKYVKRMLHSASGVCGGS